jgi:hypothetical protein
LRAFVVLMLLVSTAHATYSQMRVEVLTDKSVYTSQDSIHVSVTVHNLSTDTLKLQFVSSCQGNYILDDFDFTKHAGCYQLLTTRHVPPLSSYTWNDMFYHPSQELGWPPLSLGSHAIVGEVLGYQRSDASSITVVSPAVVTNDATRTMDFSLEAAYPNPFNGEVSIAFSIPKESRVFLALYNSAGQRIRIIVDGMLSAGCHLTSLSVADLPSGVFSA